MIIMQQKKLEFIKIETFFNIFKSIFKP